MASACVNNVVGVPPETFSSPFDWLSFTRSDDPPPPLDPPEPDFEFRLDAAAMLPADKLFSGGKLVPLHLAAAAKTSPVNETENESSVSLAIHSPEKVKIAAVKSRRRTEEASFSGNDPYLFSPKAPRCSSRWRELLGLKKLSPTTTNPSSVAETNSKLKSSSSSLKSLLHRASKPSDSSLILPLLATRDYSSSSESFESLSLTSSRLSLSSSSSSSNDDLPRHSLDFSDKAPSAMRRPIRTTPAAVRRRRAAEAAPAAAADSPRMNSSGKIVFQSLERSSSSPSSFNNGGGGARMKLHRPMERSYSANVRVVTPVLNVPVCSLRVGFGQLFSSSSQTPHKSHRNRT